MSTFGEVTYETGTDASQSSSAGGPTGTGLDQTIETLDLNDPRLASEDLTIDPQGDAYKSMPTLPDGKWRAKFKQVDVKDGKGGTTKFKPYLDKRSGALYLATAVEATVLAPDKPLYDDLKVTDYFVSTRLNKDNSMAVGTILYKLGAPLPTKVNHKQAMQALIDKLAGEPEGGIETVWEASCETCQKQAEAQGQKAPRSIQGMHRFPQIKGPNGTTVHDPHLNCQVNPSHGPMVARPRIKRYLSLDELK